MKTHDTLRLYALIFKNATGKEEIELFRKREEAKKAAATRNREYRIQEIRL